MKLKLSLWITIFGLFLFVKSESQSTGTSWGNIDIDNPQNDLLDDGSGDGTDTDGTTDDEDLLESGSGDEGSGSGTTIKVDHTTKAPPTTKKMTACQQLRSSTKDFSSDFYIPECTITGEYEKRQCEGKPGSKKCWCVDPKGREIPGTQMTEPDFPDCHEGTNLKPCVFDLLKNSRGLLGAYRPRCTIDGEYENIQCHLRECWCVDEKGIEKEGTRSFMSSHTPICEEPVLHLCNSPMVGMKCMMMCELPQSDNKPVRILRNTDEIVSCNNKTCSIENKDYEGSKISWDTHGNDTMVHFTIMNLNLDRDENKWSCNYDGVDSAQKDLSIISKPTSIMLKQMNATLECHVSCVYPDGDVSAQLFINNKPTTMTQTKTDMGSTKCSSTKETTVIFSWAEKYNPESEYRCDVSMAGVKDWTESSTIKKAEEPSSSTTTIVAIVVVVVFVIVAVAIAIILIKKRRNAKGGAQLAKTSENAEGEQEEL